MDLNKMTHIQFIEPAKNNNTQILNNIFKLRHEVFHDRLGWEVNSKDGIETDNFDQLDVVHIAMKNNDEEVIGCWRALPTTNSYMLKDVFPELGQGETLPEEENIWEISRFAVKKHNSQDKSLIKNTTIQLIQSFYEFAQEKEIQSYVLVTTVACERILRASGVKTRRLGAGKAMQIGIEKTVALWIDVADMKQTRH